MTAYSTCMFSSSVGVCIHCHSPILMVSNSTLALKKKESSSTLFFLLCFFLKFLANSYVLLGHQVAIWKKVKLGVRLFTKNSALKLFLKNTLIIDERASFFASFLASFLSSSSVKFSRNVGTKSCRIWKICL